MGLTNTTELNSGLTVNNAYYKIESYSGNVSSTTIQINVFVDRAASEAKKNPLNGYVETFAHSTAGDAPNVIKQGYEYLKTTNKLKTAIDVLE